MMLVRHDQRLTSSSARKRMGITAPTLSRVTIFFVFLYFAECAAGSCISYGHACWGGHGKRSNIPSSQMKEVALNLNALANKNWFLSRLINSKPIIESEGLQDYNTLKLSKQDNYEDQASVGIKSNLENTQGEIWQDFLDMDEDNVLAPPKTRDEKIKLYKLLRSKSEKMN